MAGSSRPDEASSSATELRRTSAASRDARAASSLACSRSSRPARQDTYTPTIATATTIRIALTTGVTCATATRPAPGGTTASYTRTTSLATTGQS